MCVSQNRASSVKLVFMCFFCLLPLRLPDIASSRGCWQFRHVERGLKKIVCKKYLLEGQCGKRAHMYTVYAD